LTVTSALFSVSKVDQSYTQPWTTLEAAAGCEAKKRNMAGNKASNRINGLTRIQSADIYKDNKPTVIYILVLAERRPDKVL
jgi:hypothetical protein